MEQLQNYHLNRLANLALTMEKMIPTKHSLFQGKSDILHSGLLDYKIQVHWFIQSVLNFLSPLFMCQFAWASSIFLSS